MEEEIITNDEFLLLIEEAAIETVEEFNLTHGTNKQLDEEITEYVIAFGIVSLLGFNALKGRKDIRDDIKKLVLDKFDSSYEGIRATNAKELRQLTNRLGRQPLAKELEEFRRERVSNITDGAVSATRNELNSLLAGQEGLTIVGGINTPDDRVRDEHTEHDGKYWLASNYQPWTDYNCRCTYVWFNSAREARQAGFTALFR